MGEGSHGPSERGSGPGRGQTAAPQAAPGQQVRRGRAGTSAARSLLTHRLAVPDPPCSRGVASSGARSFSPAGWPRRRPFSSISQPRPQLHPPPGRMQGWRHHRHRRCRLRASRSRRSWGRRGAVTELRRAPPPPPDTQAWHPACPRTLTTSLASLCAGAGGSPSSGLPSVGSGRPTGRGAGGLGRNLKSGGANSTRRPKGSRSQRDAPWHGPVGFLPALRLHSRLWGFGDCQALWTAAKDVFS